MTNRLARIVVGLVTGVTLALSVTPRAPGTGMARVDVDGEDPGRSAELQTLPEPRRRPHLRPREPPSATAQLEGPFAPPSVYTPVYPLPHHHTVGFRSGESLKGVYTLLMITNAICW